MEIVGETRKSFQDVYALSLNRDVFVRHIEGYNCHAIVFVRILCTRILFGDKDDRGGEYEALFQWVSLSEIYKFPAFAFCIGSTDQWVCLSPFSFRIIRGP